MNTTAGYFKQNFAEFMASYDEESYRVHRDKKEELFANVHGRLLGQRQPGTRRRLCRALLPSLDDRPDRLRRVQQRLHGR